MTAMPPTPDQQIGQLEALLLLAESELAAEREANAELRAEQERTNQTWRDMRDANLTLLSRAEAAEAKVAALEKQIDGHENWTDQFIQRGNRIAALSKDLARARDALKDGIGAILLGTSVACINVSAGSEPCDHCGQCQRMKARRVMVAALAPEAPSESAGCYCDSIQLAGAKCHVCVVKMQARSAWKPCACPSFWHSSLAMCQVAPDSAAGCPEGLVGCNLPAPRTSLDSRLPQATAQGEIGD